MSRLRRDRPGPPVRLVHLGLGSFFRAHQAWYTDRAADAADWGIAAFTGRRPELAEELSAQDGLYTLVTRGRAQDEFGVIHSLARAHAAGEHAAWLRHLADPGVRAVTITVTEAGYARDAAGRLDRSNPLVAADLAALRTDRAAPVRSVPARLAAGLLARRDAGAGPLALVPCDNLPGNGAALATVLADLAGELDPALPAWLEARVPTVTTMVDRITPEPTAGDRAAVLAGTGADDHCPVATEPFSEWVLAGDFPGGRPAWETAGATFTADVVPYEERKLWLLNGAHSLMAYAGSLRGHATVADAVADPVVRDWVQEWWDTCSPYLRLPAGDIAAYRDALLERFANPRIRHGLAQIVADGSQKLPVRFLPVLRRERDAGRLPAAAATTLAAWVLHLRGAGAPVSDVRAGELRERATGPLADAVPRVLSTLAAVLADDAELVTAVRDRAVDLSR